MTKERKVSTMGKKNLYKISDMVWQTLKMHPETRNSDRELISVIYSDFYGVFNQPFFKVMDRTDLPSFESIRRCRQKLQAEDEELRAVPDVEGERVTLQEDWLKFVRGEE